MIKERGHETEREGYLRKKKYIFSERLILRILIFFGDFSRSTQKNVEVALLYYTSLLNHRNSIIACYSLLNYVNGCHCVPKNPMFVEASRPVLKIVIWPQVFVISWIIINLRRCCQYIPFYPYGVLVIEVRNILHNVIACRATYMYLLLSL